MGAPTHSDYDLADFVLGTFISEEQKILAPGLENAVDAVECMIKSGIDRAMNKYNS